MDTVTIYFGASAQNLTSGGVTNYASNTVNYVKSVFDLDDNWKSFDSVRSVWNTDFESISTVLDSEGVCYVPQEVLKRTGKVTVNLVGSIVEDDELTDRLTTYPVVALVVNANAKICGTETAEVTPSQFEQYVAMVVAEVEKVTGMTATAVALPEGSAPTAVYENGVLTLGIPKGDKGDTGNGISSVVFNSDYSLTFNFTESEPYTTPPIRGERGAQGYGIVSVEKIGTAGLVDTYQVNYEDPSVPPTTFTVTNGAKGDTGNGISSVTKTGTVGLVDTYRITFTNGGHYDFNVTNGAKGDTGATGNGIATIAKTSTSGLVDTYTITFTDGTSTTFEVTNGADGEVTFDELAELLPTETVSGSIASFPDGQAVIPALSCVADIDPIQDLHGYDAPWVGGAGANLLNSDYAIKFTLSKTITFPQTILSGTKVYVHSDEFSYTTPPSSGNKYPYYVFRGANNENRGQIWGMQDGSVTLSGDAVAIELWSNGYDYGASSGVEVTISGLTISKTEQTTYSPYENICPISGHDEVEVSVCGVNVWDEVAEVGGLNVNTGATTVANRTRSKNYIPCVPNTSYYWKLPSSSGLAVCYYDASKTFISGAWEYENQAHTTPANAYFMKFCTGDAYGTTYNNDISINYPSTDHDYHAYNGTTYTTTLPSTTYGGTLDLVSGVLTVTHGYIASYNGESLPSTWISDRDVYASGTTPTIGAQVVYKLATPQTYQLTPQQIATLKGQNNITATSGQVSVTYKADIQKYIDNAIATFA